jgi:hypothetical protein
MEERGILMYFRVNFQRKRLIWRSNIDGRVMLKYKVLLRNYVVVVWMGTLIGFDGASDGCGN